MAKSRFDYIKYKEVFIELWNKKVPNTVIAEVVGIDHSTLSKIRKAWGIPAGRKGSYPKFSVEDVRKVFALHGFSEFGKTSNTNKDKAVKDIQPVQIVTTSGMLSQKTFEQQIDLYIYLNLFAPRRGVEAYIDSLYTRHYKKPLPKAFYNGSYARAFNRYKLEHGYDYPIAPGCVEDNHISEIFCFYLVYFFAEIARNKRSNPHFIRDYCLHMYGVPVSVKYFENIYKVLGLKIFNTEGSPSHDVWQDIKSSSTIDNAFFVPYPKFYSTEDCFKVPSAISDKVANYFKEKFSVDMPVVSDETLENIPEVVQKDVSVETPIDTLVETPIDTLVEVQVDTPVDAPIDAVSDESVINNEDTAGYSIDATEPVTPATVEESEEALKLKLIELSYLYANLGKLSKAVSILSLAAEFYDNN